MGFEYTVSTIFLVPTLKIDRENLRGNNFINAFIKDAMKEVSYDNAVYLVFAPKNIDRFKDFVDGEYERTQQIIEDYDYNLENKSFVVLVYSLDPRFDSDFDLIKRGKYSKTSKEFQEQFPKVVTNVQNGRQMDQLALSYHIFNKTEDLKKFWEEKIFLEFAPEMEVWEGFDEQKETLTEDKLKQLI